MAAEARAASVLSVPVADLHVVRAGLAFTRLAERLQAHEEGRPLGAAVVHELRRFPPALVLEQHDGEVVFLLELEADFRADPLGGPLDHPRVGVQLCDPHVEDAELAAVVGDLAFGDICFREVDADREYEMSTLRQLHLPAAR